MTGPNITPTSSAPFAVVLTANAWSEAILAWVDAWRKQSPSVDLLVVDRSPDAGLAGAAPETVTVVEGHRGTLSMVLNAGLEQVTAPRVLFQDTPRLPPPGFVSAVGQVPAASDAVLIGPGAPPAGVAQSALDTLMLHLVPADAVLQAPNRWSTIPGAFWALFPTELLQSMGGLEAAEPNFELAVQEACLRLARRRRPVQVHHIGWSIPRQTTRALATGIRGLTAARVRRLVRRPDTALEAGWSLASRAAVRAALDRDARGDDRQQVLEQLGSIDMQPLACMPEWAPLAQDQLRRMLVGLRQQQQRWILQGLLEGIESVNASGIPELLGRHPIRLSNGNTVLLPVEREDVDGLRTAITTFFRGGAPRRCTLAVVAGPSTSGRLRAGLGREWDSLELMAALAGSDLVLHPTSLTAPRAIRMLTPCSGWVPSARLQGDAWALHAKVTGTPAIESASHRPWPLDISRPVRLLAWPSWNDPTALHAFVHDIIEPLSTRSDVTLCLRFDPSRDGALPAARTRLEAALSGTLPENGSLEIVLLSEPMDSADARRLGQSVHAWLGHRPDPAFTQAVGAPVYAGPDPVIAIWDRLSGQALEWDAPTQ